jgi:CHAT domain-containing protein
MIVHVTDINSNYYFTRITRDDISIEKISLEPEIAELFEEAGASLVSGQTDLKKLYEIGRFVNISSIPDQIQSLILIPDGYLYQLPLAVIPVRRPDTPFSYGSARYLIEEKDIYTLNSLHELNHRPSRNNHRYDFTGFGVSDFRNQETARNLVSLPRAPQEIQNISSRLDRFQRINAFTDQAATSASFREKAGNSRILHMASHSEVSDSDPLFSRLHFYADATTEGDEMIRGQLFAYELFDLDLNNELVMLNSCESGGDRYLQGTGIMGINRALRYAGVQSLVLNTWSVNDHFAAEFAELFYQYLNTGETKSRSLQLAKKDFISTRNANPHYWGPYVLNGNNRPLINQTQNRYAALSLGFLFLFAITAAIAGRKKGAFQ